MKRIINLILLILLAGILLCQESPRFGGTIRIAKSADISTIYPWEMTDLESLFIFQNIYEPLIRLKKDTADIEPCLATHWEISKDYKTWTFHLRKNVKFHDGTPFTAKEVIESLSLKKGFPAKMRKIDDYTVVFDLPSPDAAFALTLSIEFHSIAGAATIKCFKENCKKPIVVGTGPYKFEKWIPDKLLLIKANEDYWGGKPYIEQAEFIPIKDNASVIKALKNKSIDLTHNILPSNISELKKIPFLNFQSQPSLSIAYLGMNNEKPYFKDKKVRIAISHAINKQALLKKYYYDGQAAIAAKSCLPVSMFGYYADLPEREYNIEKAKALLKEAGYPNGFETTLLPPPVTRPYLPEPIKIAEDIKKDLEIIGIKATIVNAKSWRDYLNKGFSGDFDLILFGWVADTIDPNDFLTSILASQSIGSGNVTRFSNNTFDNLLEMARSQKVSQRAKTYQKAQMIFYEEMPFVPLVSAMQLAVWNDRVKGYKIHPAARLYLQNIWLSE
jgi:peptide/nickel transport system substrate-binding protein